MASVCPACQKTLKPWHIKAECPHCGANIPNHNWEERLEEDAKNREEAFYKMHSALHLLKFTVIGTPMRIVRLVFSFLPLLGYVVPMAYLELNGADGTVISAKPINAIAFFTNNTFKFADVFKMLTDSANKTVDKPALIAFILVLASLLFGVIAFFMIPILFKKPKNPVIAVFHALSIAAYCTAPLMFNKFIASYAANAIGTIAGKAMWGIVVGALLFTIALVFDIIVLAARVDEKDYKYIPTTDVLQREYAIKAGKITEDEMPVKNVIIE